MGKVECLVTGGCGFIGSHLALRLAEMGHEVTVLDTDISHTPSHRNITVVMKDITSERIHLYDAKWVFHLAALADVIPSITNPWVYHWNNVHGTVNLLQNCLAQGVEKLVYASSTSIYGDILKVPTTEDAPANPQYPYALTKYLAEQYVMHWDQVYHLPANALRITCAYGPGMRSRGAYGSVMKVFMAQKAAGAPFTVVGDGEQSRDFVYIDDVVDAFIKAASIDVHGMVMNVGSGMPVTINRLAEIIGEDHGRVILPVRPGEPSQTFAGILKIREELNWKPRHTFEDGMAVMLDHLDDWKGETVWTEDNIKTSTADWFRLLGNAESA